MSKKISLALSAAGLTIYISLFSLIFVVITFCNQYQYNLQVQFCILTLLCIGFLFIFKIYNKTKMFITKYRYIILALFCLFVLTAQIIINSQMVPSVMYDHEKIFNGAIVWATQGNVPEFEIYCNYLHHYPHQVGLFLIQQLIFKIAAKAGFSNFFLVAGFCGHILFMITIVASFIYLDENFGSTQAIFFLSLLGLYIPIYFQSSVSYTDTWSVWAIPCILLLFSRSFKSNKVSSMIVYAIFTGIVCGIAIQIKATSIIILIALIIQLLVTKFNKKHVVALFFLLSSILCVNTVFDNWAYSTVMDESRAGEAMPTTHWIMMGLQGDGSYNSHDEWYITGSVPSDQRVEKNIEVIKQRLEEMGPSGYIKLLYRKTRRTFGSANAEMYYTYLYDNTGIPINTVYELVYQDGKYYNITDNLCQSIYLLSFIFAIVGSALILIKRHNDIYNFAPHVGLIGFWIFMMLWESNHRQLINQWSLFFITAAIGMYHIYDTFVAKE